MKRTIIALICVLAFAQIIPAQSVTIKQHKKITKEIELLFAKSIEAGEKMVIADVEASVNDTLKTGFIDNGRYYTTFQDVMTNFKNGASRVSSQKFHILEKKITVLSPTTALLTTSGKASSNLNDGRTIQTKFGWTFVYVKIDDQWQLVHTHMSNSR
ncbi:MAG: nuclear transport factor 2 family protein [Bacteroidales bacterium]|nr:nuclear transport factor 2 family protein [Bacteroidales bacterium]